MRRINTRNDVLREYLIQNTQFESVMLPVEFPVLRPVFVSNAKYSISFNELPSKPSKHAPDTIVDFYIDDVWFERLWKRTEDYTNRLAQYKAVVMPDYSLNSNMTTTDIYHNHYRAMVLCEYLNQRGITCIPNLQLLDWEHRQWQILGYPKHSTLAISTQGRVHKIAGRETFLNMIYYTLDRLEPTNLIMFGYKPKNFREMCPTEYLETRLQKRNKELGR